MIRSFAVTSLLGLFAPLAAHTQVKLPNGSGDLGAQINAAAAALPATGGKIVIQSGPTGQCYTFSVPIVITKAIIIQGQGPSTCLNFVGSGTAVTFAGGSSSLVPGGGFVDGFGLRDLLLVGSGASGNQTGLLLGGTTNTVGFYATGITISNFGLGLQLGRGTWNFKMEHSALNMNGQSVHWASSVHFGGENTIFDGVTFVGATFNNSVEFDDESSTEFSNLANLTMVSCNFDSAQLVLNNGAGGIRLYSPHFENASPSSGTEPFVRISAFTAATDVVMDGPDFYNDQNNPYPPSFIEIDGGPTVTITQMRSLNFDATTNVPTNVLINGWATVTLIGNAPLRAAQHQYTITPGNSPLVSVIGSQDSSNQLTSPIVNGVLTSNVPDGTAPFSVESHTPPTNLNAWPATFAPSGEQIQNPHFTTGMVDLPTSGTATVNFQGASAFNQPPTCNVSYQSTLQLPQARTLSFFAYPNQIIVFGQPYLGVHFMCLGN